MILLNGKIRRNQIIVPLIVLSAFVSSAASAIQTEIVIQQSELLRQGNTYLEKGEIDKAKKSLMRALKSNLTDRQRATTMNSLCVAHLKEESWRKAEKFCDKAIEIFPVDWRYYNNRGNVYLGLGKIKAAIEQYEKGLDLAPNSSVITSNIELANARYLKAGKKTRSN
jgi:tetratricopeptide (TPR) repeat protein